MRTRNVMLPCAIQYFLIFLIPTESFHYQVLPFPNDLAENVREYGLNDIKGTAMSCGGIYKMKFAPDTPHTVIGAKPDEWRRVENKRVIHITGAYYRRSTFSGTFELEEQKDTPFIPSPKGDRVKVLCYWFCCRPETTWPQILIENADFKIEEGYSGEVAKNIAR